MSKDNKEIELNNELSGEDLEALLAIDEAEAEDNNYPYISLD